MPSSKEAPDPAHVPLLDTLHKAYRVKQEVSRWYRDLLTQALAKGINTAIIARAVGVTPQAISTARIRLWPAGNTEEQSPNPESMEDIVERIRDIRDQELSAQEESGDDHE